ncbi:prolipoprotein diacylglyceryl transferase [Kiloniella laminariae]|uniref:Phosphatidylglycerol--prolipoprotein diacylglyceryl transferase n=1 Tax=Kiloniella laminariae TaxID=454162 RepID=A0ABT4LL81_9PROT|nr:prolipoprotein diacylglyceryl transferase [Kiloniella laminariae]MCZ4281863.1 prolipoprotein diacylglyceryl transferase [Kiloniella laminariae]
MLAALAYPEIDPIAVSIGPFAIRWYSLAYIFGIVIGWRYCRWLCFQAPRLVRPIAMDDFMVWATLGIILGGRLGYVLFYNFTYFLSNPLEIFAVWQGGMSFHGGLLGVITAMFFFARREKIHFFTLADIVACAAPIGLLLGRLANFINGELFGRVTTAEIGMVFPNGGPLPRHPSQLYEAGLEGVALFLVLYLVVRLDGLKRRGLISGLFMIGYGLSRSTVEFFREPDAHIGFLFGGTTMGQLLSIPMILAGLTIAVMAFRLPQQITGPEHKPEDISPKAADAAAKNKSGSGKK